MSLYAGLNKTYENVSQVGNLDIFNGTKVNKAVYYTIIDFWWGWRHDLSTLEIDNVESWGW